MLITKHGPQTLFESRIQNFDHAGQQPYVVTSLLLLLAAENGFFLLPSAVGLECDLARPATVRDTRLFATSPFVTT